MNENYGMVEFEGRTYELTEQAYPENYGISGEICYKATAKLQGDESEEVYMVTWKTTETWNEYTKLHEEYVEENGNDNSDWIAYLEDGSNACDWDNPISVDQI